jgi:hypothetical protein
MMESMPSKNAAQRGRLPKGFSKATERERALMCVMLLSDAKGDAVSWALNVFGSEDGFHVLRKMSSLKAVFPDDTHVIARFLTARQRDKLTVYSDSLDFAPVTVAFPRFNEIASVSEKVRCYFLYKRIKNRRIVAHIMGWRDDEVRRTYETMDKRIKALKGAI